MHGQLANTMVQPELSMGQKLGSTNVLGGVSLNSVAPGRLERIYVIFNVILMIDD